MKYCRPPGAGPVRRCGGTQKEITARESACNRAIEEARISAALVVAQRKKELAQQEMEIRREEELNPSVRGLATFTSRWRSTIFVVFGSPGQP